MNISKRDLRKQSVFLAGSIGGPGGLCIDWQTNLAEFFLSQGYNVFNPRRDDWDNTWIQSYENPNFFQQVSWELNALDIANVIIMNFVPDTIGPISLLELGLYASSKKMQVVCPPGYFRKGNVEVVCDRYNIPLHDSINNLKGMLF